MRTIGRMMAAAVLALAMTTVAAIAASEFEGVWKVKDSSGKPFEITLSADGTATATRGKGMQGKWKEEGGAAVITWTTGWLTKITKEGSGYKKAAYKKDLSAAPTNISDAVKAK